MGSKRHRERAALLQQQQQQQRGGRRVEEQSPSSSPTTNNNKKKRSSTPSLQSETNNFAGAQIQKNGNTTAATETPCNTSTVIMESITPEKLNTTIEVLTLLSTNIDLFRSPQYKSLRKVVFPLVQPLNTTAGTSFIVRITDALKDERWLDAKLTLEGLRASGEGTPKLGTVQRWVRECDIVEGNQDALIVLDLILRIAAPEQIAKHAAPSKALEASKGDVTISLPEWVGKDLRAESSVEASKLPMTRQQQATATKIKDAIKKKQNSTSSNIWTEAASCAKQFFVLSRESPTDRRPPNLHEMIIYSCRKGAMPMVEASVQKAIITSKEVPCAPHSIFLSDILTQHEASLVVHTAESVGFTPDVPQTGKKSVLAHNFVWMAEEFIGNVFERCKHLLPQQIDGDPIVGLNGRLRCYRYEPGAVYRPHVDGAWPMSGVDKETGEYKYDVSNGLISSKLTFLMYLNEGFEGGCTTFYTPALEEGKLAATPVAPRAGCCLVFPHGDSNGCLVHEGSGVRAGVKYIIRTEVLYKLKAPLIPKYQQ